ncbi:acyltransferase family protein [Caulobacter endophyticus]|uniref:acyltransferase family protein n=1 Tax=Caulobacter endophyticus TaxID=2172652 RepID=UPI0024108BFF|nr:acyltransferase [Caulobacter endophyticus]MDG2529620.1 acyltransferase [Caulobacter endophyticus]
MSDTGANTAKVARPLSRGGPLDALRFFAAFFIVVYHYAEQAPVSLFAIHPAFGRGYLATDFFLLLSGYVLGRAYGSRVADGRIHDGAFLIKRIGRVWPAHLVMIAAFVVLVLGATALGMQPRNPQWYQWDQLPQQVFLIQTWGFQGPSGWNMPTWTLSALLVCYALFPTLWRLFGKIASPWTALLVGAAVFVAVDVFSRQMFGMPSFHLHLKNGLYRAIPLFLMGVLIARLAREVVIGPKLADALAVFAVVGFVVLNVVGEYAYPSLALLGLLIFAASGSARNGWGWAKTGGRLSFSLYLTNQFVGAVWFAMQRLLDQKVELHEAAHWAIWAMAFPAALVFAWLFERLVDAPLQDWLKPRLDKVTADWGGKRERNQAAQAMVTPLS